jgi:hypothetical protein
MPTAALSRRKFRYGKFLLLVVIAAAGAGPADKSFVLQDNSDSISPTTQSTDSRPTRAVEMPPGRVGTKMPLPDAAALKLAVAKALKHPLKNRMLP